MAARLAWLGLTPEPERELPIAVATLRARRATRVGRHNEDLLPWVDAEVRRIDHLILRGNQRSWLRYLADVTRLITDATGDAAPILQAAEAVLTHHRMLIGLPGSGYERVSADRATLAALVTRLREDER